jgi:tetratricopeptide (TPR) repeat protein
MTDGPALLGRGAFVGRGGEMEQVVAALEAALEGAGAVFLVGGEPGIGKSRLAEEVSIRARVRGFGVLWGRCWEEGGAPAYWPWVQCIRSLMRHRGAAVVAPDLAARAAEVAQLVPELRDLIPGIPQPAEADPETARFRLFDAAAALFRAAGEAEPLALVVDDLHAADQPSLLFLRFLAAEVAEGRVLVLGTYRDTALDAEHPLAGTMAELARQRNAHRIMLGGFSEADISRYIEVSTGVRAPPELVAAIRAETEGNPLFVGEIVRLLASEGGLGQAAGVPAWPDRIPAGVQEAIGRRLAQLPERCREVLGVASVLGRDFGLDALERATGLSADALLETLDQAVVARLITEAPGGLGRLRFSHALVRDSIYEDISPARRIRLHRRMGEILERLHVADPEPHLSEIARHFIEASPGGDATRSVEYARRAGDYAMRLLAWEEALRLYQTALGALDLVGRPEDQLRCELLLSKGEALVKSGALPEARETFLGGAGIARRMGSAEHLARAALGYGGLVWQRAGDDPRLIPLLEEALGALSAEDGDLRVRVLSRLSGALRDEADRGRRDVLSGEAVDMARRLGDPDTLAYALVARYTAIWGPDNAPELLELATEIVALAKGIGDRDRLLEGTLVRHKALMALGDLRAARTELAAATRLAEELRQPSQLWYVAADRSALALLEGRFEEAEGLIERALDIGRQAQRMEAHSTYTLQMWSLRREQGRLEEVLALVRGGDEDFPWYPLFRCCLANVYAELGEKGRARALVDELAPDRFAAIPLDNEWLFSICLLPEPAAELEDASTAQVLYELLAPFEGLPAYSAPELFLGAVSRYLGILAGTLGRREEAEAHFERAARENERMEALPWLVRTRRDHAALLMRGNRADHDRALALAASGLEVARRLGMAAMEGELSALLERRVSTPAGAAPAGHSFRREGEYWSIGFEGRAFRLRDTKGLHYLAHLLTAPGREVHALDLLSAEEGVDVRAAGIDRTGEDGLVAGRPDGGDEILDRQARESYRRRLVELEEEIEEARSWADPERAARAEEERDALVRELASAMGLGGRSRKTVSASERARVNVTRAIRAALARIREHHPELGQHLERTVSTGTYCAYRPDPRAPVDWNVAS